MNNPILYISDIHLGSSLFNLEEGLIEILKNDYRKIYILGDLIDTWEMTPEDVVRKYERVINFIRSKKRISIIRGNHDPELEVLQSIFPNTAVYDSEHYETIDGYRVAMIHGDKFDSLITPYFFVFNRFLKGFYSLGDRFNFNLKDDVRDFYYKLKHKYYTYNIISNIERYTVNTFRGKCDVVITGHTHQPRLLVTEDIKYVNCGAFVYKPSFVEYLDGRYSIIKL